jgi:hypothetical protein
MKKLTVGFRNFENALKQRKNIVPHVTKWSRRRCFACTKHYFHSFCWAAVTSWGKKQFHCNCYNHEMTQDATHLEKFMTKREGVNIVLNNVTSSNCNCNTCETCSNEICNKINYRNCQLQGKSVAYENYPSQSTTVPRNMILSYRILDSWNTMSQKV